MTIIVIYLFIAFFVIMDTMAEIEDQHKGKLNIKDIIMTFVYGLLWLPFLILKLLKL